MLMAPLVRPGDCLVRRCATVAPTAAEDYTRQQLEQRQAEYEARQRAAAVRNADDGALPSLEMLPLEPFIEDGKIRDPGVGPKTKASVFAVYDKDTTLQYVGKSRDAQQSLRTILVRQPDLCYSFKVFHVEKPSRSFLEQVAEKWILAGAPKGNDGGDIQKTWEAPFDVKPLMTSEDIKDYEVKKLRGKEGLALKAVCRRFEADKKSILLDRGLTESIKFDAKLKGQGLLDLTLNKLPASDIPSSKPPKPTSASKK